MKEEHSFRWKFNKFNFFHYMLNKNRDNESNKNEKKREKGIIYFIQPAELVGTDRYKIGCSKINNLKRCNSYRKGSRYICIMECNDILVLESKIKKVFKEKYKLCAGTEYFIGNEEKMFKTFINLVIEFKSWK